jgi:hypothetical protein
MPEIDLRILARAALPVLLATTFVAGGCGEAGATITRLTVGTPGPDPYMLAAGTDRQQVKPSRRAGGTEDGDMPGLYGGTRRSASCDSAKLVAFLQANPDKAAAWAKVRGIAAKDIPQYVRRLTPVLLRVDTLVTNHGYKNGKANKIPAVLRAGMGVLVDQYGIPVVKCNCGNPLTPPEKKISPGKAKYKGASWPGFSPDTVTKIRNSSAVTTFVLVDPDGTMAFDRPVATAGNADGPPEPLPVTETATPHPEGSGTLEPGTSPGPGDPSELPTGGPGGGTPEPGTTGEQPGGGQPGTPDQPGGGDPDSPEQQPGGGEPGTPNQQPGGGEPGTPDRQPGGEPESPNRQRQQQPDEQPDEQPDQQPEQQPEEQPGGPPPASLVTLPLLI